VATGVLSCQRAGDAGRAGHHSGAAARAARVMGRFTSASSSEYSGTGSRFLGGVPRDLAFGAGPDDGVFGRIPESATGGKHLRQCKGAASYRAAGNDPGADWFLEASVNFKVLHGNLLVVAAAAEPRRGK